MSFGFPVELIDDLEVSEENDWKAAARAMEINRELSLMNIAIFGQPADKKAKKAREGVFQKKKNEQLSIFGINPMESGEQGNSKTRNMLKSLPKLKKKKKK